MKENTMGKTFFQLLMIMGAYMLLFLLIGLWVFEKKQEYLIGLLCGIGIAILLLLDMYRSIQKICVMEEKKAEMYAKGKVFFRMGIFAVLVGAALYYLDLYSIIGLLFGVITIKLGAYTQPIFFRKIRKEAK